MFVCRDENGADTDGTEWCHICFHIFLRKRKQIQKPRKQIQKQILSETDTDQIRCGDGTKNRCLPEPSEPLNNAGKLKQTNKFINLIRRNKLKYNTVFLNYQLWQENT